ncbi:MAG: DUF5076 domain-containing protein [Terriglobales bacterium]
MSLENQLPIPPSAAGDKQATELLRAWVANNSLHCSLNLGCWGDDEAIIWGILLSDVARHVANSLEQQQGLKKLETLGKIREHFNLELDSPTGTHTLDVN